MSRYNSDFKAETVHGAFEFGEDKVKETPENI